MSTRVRFEALRSLASGSISGTYAAVGVPLANPARLVCITNDTEGNMIFSVDGVTDHLFVAAGNFKLFDLQTNARPCNESAFMLETGTQFYVKQNEAPVSGSVYIEVVYAP